MAGGATDLTRTPSVTFARTIESIHKRFVNESEADNHLADALSVFLNRAGYQPGIPIWPIHRSARSRRGSADAFICCLTWALLHPRRRWPATCLNISISFHDITPRLRPPAPHAPAFKATNLDSACLLPTGSTSTMRTCPTGIGPVAPHGRIISVRRESRMPEQSRASSSVEVQSPDRLDPAGHGPVQRQALHDIPETATKRTCNTR